MVTNFGNQNYSAGVPISAIFEKSDDLSAIYQKFMEPAKYFD